MIAEPSQDGILVVEFQGDVVRTIALPFAVLAIGRSPDNDLPLQHPSVSRRHAELRSGAAGMVVTDLASANGTFVDGERILPNQPTRFEYGQALQVGPFVLSIRRSPVDRPHEVRPLPPESNGGVGRRGGRASIDHAMPLPIHARRPTRPVGQPSGRQSKYLEYLPAVFADNDFLGRYLLIFESIWEALEQRQDHIAMYFDPATCPEPLLPWLAGWFDMKTGAHWAESHTRAVVDEVADLYRYRGTRYGLTKMIEIWTGYTPEITEKSGEPFVFYVRLEVRAGGGIDRAQLEELLQEHKPAATGFVLEIEGA